MRRTRGRERGRTEGCRRRKREYEERGREKKGACKTWRWREDGKWRGKRWPGGGRVGKGNAEGGGEWRKL